jgi:hypothetical protein
VGDSSLRGKYHVRKPLKFRTSRKIRFFLCDRTVVRSYQTKYVFVPRGFFVASADQHSKISARAPRSGNAATLPTLQLASRQAGCATRPAFRHRKQAHERSARARLCHSSARAWRSARMKRSGAEQLLLIWSGCGGRLNGVAVATAKRRCSGDAPCHARSRCRFTGGAILQSCRLHFTSIGRSTGCNAVARPDCGLLHVFLAAFGRLVGEMRLEGRRR